jgi:hypothetical protein
MDGSPSHGLTLNHLPKSIKSKFKDSSKYESLKKKQDALDKQRQNILVGTIRYHFGLS